MARLLWLADALVDAGCKVNPIAGWELRGKATMDPRAVLIHHTVAPKGRPAPTLEAAIDGRPDLVGPLCHVLIGRDGICHLIAAGRANHAGKGRWGTANRNDHCIGIEVENTGYAPPDPRGEPWTADLYDVMVRASAACVKGAGLTSAAVCGHKEYAEPKGRKVDPHTLDMGDFRDAVHRVLAPPSTPKPEPTPPPPTPILPVEDTPMILLLKASDVEEAPVHLVVANNVFAHLATPSDVAEVVQTLEFQAKGQFGKVTSLTSKSVDAIKAAVK